MRIAKAEASAADLPSSINFVLNGFAWEMS